MFLLCDDIRSMLRFCYKLWKDVCDYPRPDSPVVERLLRIIHYVYSKDIKPKKRVYQEGGSCSVHWEFIRTSWMDFTDGTVILHRLVDILRKDTSFDDRLLSSAIEKYKQQVLKKLEDKLGSAKHVSEANGFARATIKSSVSCLWESLFDEETATPRRMLIKTTIFRDLFLPIFDESRRSTTSYLLSSDFVTHNKAKSKYSPYVLGRDFAKQELKEEVVQLGVELSLYVAQSMFLLCDDIRSMLRFCCKLLKDAIRYQNYDSLVVERLLRVIHYVYSKDIKPKNGVYQNGGNSVQWRLTTTTWEHFKAGITDLDGLVLILRGDGSFIDGRELTTSIEEALKKVEEKLRCAKAVSEANGFARETMKSSFLDLWKSVFDNEAKEATQTLKMIRNGMIRDLFLPLWNEAAAP